MSARGGGTRGQADTCSRPPARPPRPAGPTRAGTRASSRSGTCCRRPPRSSRSAACRARGAAGAKGGVAGLRAREGRALRRAVPRCARARGARTHHLGAPQVQRVPREALRQRVGLLAHVVLIRLDGAVRRHDLIWREGERGTDGERWVARRAGGPDGPRASHKLLKYGIAAATPKVKRAAGGRRRITALSPVKGEALCHPTITRLMKRQ